MRRLLHATGRARGMLWHAAVRQPVQSFGSMLRALPACECRPGQVRATAGVIARYASTESETRSDAGASGGARPDAARPADEREPASRLLEHSLPYVKSLGWTDDALRAGALAAGLSPASVGLLPRGPVQLVEHFTTVCDQAFVELLDRKQEEFAGMRTQHRIAAAVRMRLEMLQPHIASWSQALSLQAQPQNAVAALRHRAALVDEIWHAAGDKSSDLSWYSKRAALGAVYTAVELFMLTDVSPDFEDTWAFLDRSLRGVTEAGKTMNEISLAAATAFRGVTKRFDHEEPSSSKPNAAEERTKGEDKA